MSSDVQIESSSITHLEFAPPCDITRGPDRSPCGSPAEWIVSIERHCKPEVQTRLWCDEHLKRALSGEPFRCPHCGNDGYPGKRIKSMERITS